MIFRLERRWVRVLLLLGLGACLATLGAKFSAMHIRASATDLISSARHIYSTADARREVASWRSRAGEHFWQESDSPGGDHNYDGQIGNGLMSRLYVAEPAVLTVSVTMRGDDLRSVTVILTTGGRRNSTASVWVQEWFDSKQPSEIHVSSKDRPWKAIVEFAASAPEAQREKAFDFNTNCLVQFRGCASAEDILPSVWTLGRRVSYRHPKTRQPADMKAVSEFNLCTPDWTPDAYYQSLLDDKSDCKCITGKLYALNLRVNRRVAQPTGGCRTLCVFTGKGYGSFLAFCLRRR